MYVYVCKHMNTRARARTHTQNAGMADTRPAASTGKISQKSTLCVIKRYGINVVDGV